MNMEKALAHCFTFLPGHGKDMARLKYEVKVRLQNNIFPDSGHFDGKKFGTTKLPKSYALSKRGDGNKSDLWS